MIWVVGVLLGEEVMGGGILHTIFVTGILERRVRIRVTMRTERTYSVSLFIVHEGGDGTVLRGTMPCLHTNTDSSPSNPKLVNRARDDAREGGTTIRRH